MGPKSTPSKVPKGPQIRLRCKALGIWEQYCPKREAYKSEGLTPREATVRAYTEMGIEAQWADYLKRDAQRVIVGAEVPLTPKEMEEVHPTYRAPSATSGAKIGEEILSLAEQIRWVKQRLARMRNGEDAPAEFPSADTLYWFQTAIARSRDFDSIVMKIEAPGKDSDDPMALDGEYQFGEIEKQLKAALKEVGSQLLAMEPGFGELVGSLMEAA